jgi:integrase
LNDFLYRHDFLIFEGVRKDNPIREVRARYLSQYKTASEQHTHKIISVEDAARLVDACVDIRDKAMLLIMLKTGIRRGELLSMEVGDINWKNQSIMLKPKKKRSNRIVFFDDESGILSEALAGSQRISKPHESGPLDFDLGEKGSTTDLCSLQYRRLRFNADCMILRHRGWRITFQHIAPGISLPPASCAPECPGSSFKSCGGM